MYTSRTGSPLMLFTEPRSPLFWPSKAYMKSVCWSFRPPPQALMPGVSTSGRATPMPDHISSSTPALDPLSRTLTRYSHSYFSWLKPTSKIYRTIDPSSLTPIWSPPEDQHLATSSQIASNPTDRPQQHPLLDEQLVSSSLKVVINNGKTYKNREVIVLIAKVDGVVSIWHNVYKRLSPCLGVAKKSQSDSRQRYSHGSER